MTKAKKVEKVSVPEVEHPPKPVEAPKSSESSAGSEIAAAIAQGLRDAKEDKRIRVVSDRSVTPRFSVVRNKQGEIMLRENESNVLSRVQLESIEEQEASIQGQEVEEV